MAKAVPRAAPRSNKARAKPAARSKKQEAKMAEKQQQQAELPAEPVNDRREGMLRDPVIWKEGGKGDGEIVSYVKDIGNGDPGYNAALRQVLIMKQDGTEAVVPETEITREREVLRPPVSHEPNRVPEATFPPDLKGEGPDEGDATKQNLQARPAPSSGEQVGVSNRTTGASVQQPAAAPKSTGAKK